MKAQLALLGLPLLAPAASAQIVIQGDGPGARLGEHFDVLGDINGDGLPDLVAGYPADSSQGTNAGRAHILSGADGSVLRTHFGAGAGDNFGSQVAMAGFVDADGVADYMVSATGFGSEKGAVYVYSGATGFLLHFKSGANAGDQFGAALSRAGDVNNDGLEDLIVGAPKRGDGRVSMLSGATGSTLYSSAAPNNFYTGPNYGSYVADLGDVNGDGTPDFLAGCNSTNHFHDYNGGTVRVLSGVDGAELYLEFGYDDGHGLVNVVGGGLSGAGDVDGDGVEDYTYGMVYYWGQHTIELHSGATGQVLSSNSITVPTSSFDTAYESQPTNVGDMDGDGVSEVAYLDPTTEAVHIHSWVTGQDLQIIPAPALGADFGLVIRGLDDVTGDGTRDIAIGSSGADGSNGTDAGEIRIYSFVPCLPPTNYCSALPNTSGNAAQISYAGSTSVAANDLLLTASDCPPNKPGLFFYGPTQISTPYADGVLCVGTGSVGYFRVQPVVFSNGQGDVSLAIDNTSGILGSGPGHLAPGSTWNFQLWFRDPQGGPGGFNFSDGLEVPFCP